MSKLYEIWFEFQALEWKQARLGWQESSSVHCWCWKSAESSQKTLFSTLLNEVTEDTCKAAFTDHAYLCAEIRGSFDGKHFACFSFILKKYHAYFRSKKRVIVKSRLRWYRNFMSSFQLPISLMIWAFYCWKLPWKDYICSPNPSQKTN